MATIATERLILRPPAPDDAPAIARAIDADPARGRGLMTEALIAVVRWSAAEHGLRDLHLTTHPDNLASQRVAEAAGFVHAGLVVHEPPFGDGGMRAVRFERPR